MKSTVAAYIRVSTEDQIEFSPESQKKALMNYAEKNDMNLPSEFIFIDEGISGKSTQKRASFNQMIAMAKLKPKPFDAILVWKFSRFARNREDSIVYKSMLRKELGIDVISISENIGDDKMSILFEAMIEAMDEYYSINLAEEVKRGMVEKAKRGGVLTTPAFGYRVEDGKYLIVPSEATVVKKVFQDYNAGKGFLTIAKELNAIGIKTHRGNKIENRTVEYWLHNPIYIGKIRWNPKGATSRNYNCDSLIISDGEHEPIIDLKLWEQVQKRLGDQKNKYVKNHKANRETLSNWCVGLVRCGECGAVLGNMTGTFSCSKKSKGLCKGNGVISARKLNNIVISYLKEVLASDTVEIITSPSPENSKSKAVCRELDFLTAELSRIELRMMRIKNAYEDGVDTLEEYRENKSKLQSDRISLTEKIDTLKKEERNTQGQTKLNKESVRRLVDILEDQSIPNIEKNEALRKRIKEITKCGKYGKTIKIVFWE